MQEKTVLIFGPSLHCRATGALEPGTSSKSNMVTVHVQMQSLLSLILLLNLYECRSVNSNNKGTKQPENEDLSRFKPPNFVDVSSLTATEQEPPNYASKRQHLPECATQQVCNAIFVKMNHTQHLCDCSANYNWECSMDQTVTDGHTIELTRKHDKAVYTQIKLCEPMMAIRSCKNPTDWTLLALQSERTGKAHYVAVCRCPEWATLEGPYTHNYPPYARIPGIRVYGMLCAQQNRLKKQEGAKQEEENQGYPEFPWDYAYAILNSTAMTQLFS